MMSMDVRDYVKIYDNFLEKQFCKDIVKKLKKVDWVKHTYYNSTKEEHESYDNDLSVSFGADLEKTQIILDKIWFALKRYVEHIDSMNIPYKSWNGYTPVRYNRYDKNTEMRNHVDHIHSMFDGNRKGVPILSIVGALNDDYGGGEFIMWQDQKIELKAGQIMIFPSNFLYPHKVTPVTKGCRFSYVSWAW